MGVAVNYEKVKPMEYAKMTPEKPEPILEKLKLDEDVKYEKVQEEQQPELSETMVGKTLKDATVV